MGIGSRVMFKMMDSFLCSEWILENNPVISNNIVTENCKGLTLEDDQSSQQPMKQGWSMAGIMLAGRINL